VKNFTLKNNKTVIFAFITVSRNCNFCANSKAL